MGVGEDNCDLFDVDVFPLASCSDSLADDALTIFLVCFAV